MTPNATVHAFDLADGCTVRVNGEAVVLDTADALRAECTVVCLDAHGAGGSAAALRRAARGAS